MRRLIAFSSVAALLAFSSVAFAQNPLPTQTQDQGVDPESQYKTLKAQTSYLMGLQAGYSFQRDGLTEIDTDAMVQGIVDAFAKSEPKVDPAKFQQIVMGFVQKLEADHIAKCEAEAPGNREAGQRFLDENKLREGVTTTPSGLQYKVITKGTGSTPKETDLVTFHYRGRLVDGTVFDDSYKGGVPAQIPMNNLIPGWVEAMKMMKEGGKWELFVPADLAYGDKPRRGSGVPAGATLQFEVELIKTEASPQGGGFNLQGIQGAGGGGGN